MRKEIKYLLLIFTVALCSSNVIWANSQEDFKRHFQQGVEFFEQNKLDEALTKFKFCAKLSPDNPEPFFHLGRIHEQQDRLINAMDAYETVIKLNPSHFLGHKYLAGLYYKKICFAMHSKLTIEPCKFNRMILKPTTSSETCSLNCSIILRH
ncbi:tetratricopeptide repeat protein [candidate division KSB1 bacterium]|nr:tetratricopeptide repeat protein [candidate division KSB1 bacterium]